MRKHRKLLILVLLLAALGAGAGLLYWRTYSPPEIARLLPDGDRLIYLNLKPTHLLDLSKSSPVQVEGDYREFVEQTGIQFERDLDEVAISQTDAENGRDVLSSEVFVGHFDRARLENYLQKIARQTESYRNQRIFEIQHEGHLVRACVLDTSRVAVTNMGSSAAIHQIVDSVLQPSKGPELLQNFYRHVPFGSMVWIIAYFPEHSSSAQLPGGFSVGFLENKVAVVSVRYNGAAALKAQVFAENETDARHVQEQVQTFLTMYHAVSKTLRPKGGDADVKAAMDSVQVTQKGNVATLTATLSEKFLRKMISEVKPEVVASAPTPSPSPTPAASKHKP
jgi:hypothetical protein